MRKHFLLKNERFRQNLLKTSKHLFSKAFGFCYLQIMKITILPFGALTDSVSPDAFSLENAQIATVSQLHAHLSAQYPAIASQKFRYAVNQELVDEQHPLQDGDEVALLPPFSGG